MTTVAGTPVEAQLVRDRALSEVQDRVLWLSMQIVDYANNVRPNTDGIKVGGHQASTASVVTVLTSLYFDFMEAGDRLSVKPHASPAFHAVQYLLGNLEPHHLKTLREFHGLQAYPSRTKDPDPVDFSSGSVGLAPVATNFAALVAEYLRDRSGNGPVTAPSRYISLLGDAELDEGSVWEAIAEPVMEDVPNLLWIVDLNRQSLDRVIPGIRVRAWRDMFAANGWNVIDAKYGKKLEAAFAEPNGELLRNAIDGMSNPVYQRLLRLPKEAVREWLPKSSPFSRDVARLIDRWSDDELVELLGNLGGHDFSTLREALSRAAVRTGPHVVFAYTLKGWRLPSVGDPQNHSVILSREQMNSLRESLSIPEEEAWSRLEGNGPAAALVRDTAKRLAPSSTPPVAPDIHVPVELGSGYRGRMSTQQIFGLILTEISRSVPQVAERIATLSPDVASSTNLGGWINKAGVWSRSHGEALPEEDIVRALKWDESPRGRHMALGISENNLFMMLGQLGLSFEMEDELLFPIGTLYDPFVRRGLDAFVFSVYSGARFIVVGTPSGISLAPEGGAHQSLITPSIGAEIPDLAFYDLCFGQELEWVMLSALEAVRNRTECTYLRLTSKRVDQGIMKVPAEPARRDALRRQVLSGAYRLVDRRSSPGYAPGENVVHIMASGAIVPEAVEASRLLSEEGVYANVISVTGPGPLYRRYQAAVKASDGIKRELTGFLTDVIPLNDDVPVVTVVDGHPHSLAWLGSALNTPSYPLGVSDYGQSGSMRDLYREYGIDADSIMNACYSVLDC